MKFSTLKKTDITISKIGLGTNAVGGHNLFSNLNENQGKEMVRHAIHNGITLIDTADMYGKGRSEELIGEVLKTTNREELVLATKGGNQWFEDGSIRPNNKPEYLRKAVENSLSRLQTDYIDLYYIHLPDNETNLAEAVAELSRLKTEGKIRAIGISNVNLEQLKEANQTGEIVALQTAYHMFNHSVETDLLPYCVENNISFIPYGPLAFGLLGGQYTKDFRLSSGDWRNSIPLFQEENFPKTLDKVEELKNIAQQKGISLSSLALAWLLSQNGVDAVIPGGKRPEHIDANLDASDMVLTKEELEAVEAILHK
ncbi:aldo/keto reductase [Bacillus benzoevorans]|uniref:Aryl-alcohol dehydrogenase-like predicted oxidoreductase n=1 Tax=Bacillus benzoevorans TaxID=1456 RepID=A0A7X0HRH1_9BACI|nr:aldo/keto reductase [Bacillus benzoevorans]MBB6444437.1 aryl-alcohol dehydrogenase-like predicted oxidoreductase [Bacillus benzoevorans]